MDVRPIALEGQVVRLELLDPRHAGDLFEAGRDASLWSYMPRGPFVSAADTRVWIDEALAAARGGSQSPFAIVDRSSSRAIGSTRYLDIRPAHRGLEIGWTWIATAHQRSGVNTDCKRLMFAHAFEELGALRVQLKTDARNVCSQRAIERIGAVREGVLRRHMIAGDGVMRDTVMYSVTDLEWPRVKRLLEALQRDHGRSSA